MKRFPSEIFRTENLSVSVFKVINKIFLVKNVF